MRIGERIRSLREEKSMTQQELATILGKSRAAIGKYETGARMPDNSTIQEICDYFNTTYDYLMGRSNYKQDTPFALEKCLHPDTKITFGGKLLDLKQKNAILEIAQTITMLNNEEEA